MNARHLCACLGGTVLMLVSWAPEACRQTRRNRPPRVRLAADHLDYTGRTEAVESVEIRARVTGFLDKTLFREGSAVKKGDILFEIDPHPYQAQLDEALAQVNVHKAHLKVVEAKLDRLRAATAAGTVVKQDLDEAQGAVEETNARIKAAEAALIVYKLNLEFCHVTSPIDGVVGRYRFTPGNLVNQDKTLLTTVVSKDPMYVYFDMDQSAFLNLRKAIKDGKLKATKLTELPVAAGLANEDGYPRKGTLNFVDNRVDPATGAIWLRVVLPNGDGDLVPGLFVRVRLTTGDASKTGRGTEEGGSKRGK